MEKGRKIHDRLLVSKELLRDHKVMLRTYSLSFTGEELVQWLVANKEVADKDEGIIFGQALVESGVIHHGRGIYICFLLCLSSFVWFDLFGHQ